MLIVMHQRQEWLPFLTEGNSPHQPTEVFDPKRHGSMKVVVAGKKLLARDTRLWPVLTGLYRVKRPFLAHVSAFCRCEKEIHYCHPLWLQITTLPSELNARGIPIVIKKQQLMVAHVWVGNDEPGHPYQFLNREELLPGSVGHSTHYWADFFQAKLPWQATMPEDTGGVALTGTTHSVTMPA